MQILLINGSPRRNGNTATALKALQRGLHQAHSDAKIELLNVVDLKLTGCIDCDSCKHNGGHCVLPDHGDEFVEKILKADMIIFGSPVYWWGITAQAKAALDKFYARNDDLCNANKKFGIIAVGAAELDDPEYQIIADQFRCIADFLGWELVLSEGIVADKLGDLEKDHKQLQIIEQKGAAL